MKCKVDHGCLIGVIDIKNNDDENWNFVHENENIKEPFFPFKFCPMCSEAVDGHSVLLKIYKNLHHQWQQI